MHCIEVDCPSGNGVKGVQGTTVLVLNPPTIPTCPPVWLPRCTAGIISPVVHLLPMLAVRHGVARRMYAG